MQSHVQTAVTPPAPTAQPAMTGGPASGESHALEHVVTLLDYSLQRESPQRYRQPRQSHVGHTRARGPCAICGCDDHDTASHCRRERLCFRCHAAGHRSATCSAPPASGSSTALAVPSTQQGNELAHARRGLVEGQLAYPHMMMRMIFSCFFPCLCNNRQ